MTLQEMSQNIKLHKILQERERILSALDDGAQIGGQEITGMPHGTAVGDPVYELVREKERLREEIELIMAKITALESNIETFLHTVDDSVVRIILRLRFIELLPWREVAQRTGHKNGRETVRKMVERYFYGYTEI
jgi:hypothetical protein